MRTLGHAVLASLAQGPRTGYDIAKVMKIPIGYFWTASHSHIYPELRALERDGLIDHLVVDGPGPRDNRLYSITQPGREALDRWIDSPLTPQPPRSELMLRVRTLWAISPQRAQSFLDGVRLDSEHRLASYREIEAQFAAEGDDHHDPRTPAFWSYATLRAGIGYEHHLSAWCQDISEQVRATSEQARAADRGAVEAWVAAPPAVDEPEA